MFTSQIFSRFSRERRIIIGRQKRENDGDDE
jgi:hypothetical protein